jgi:YidC/Oxa1 family membrane protein insertase
MTTIFGVPVDAAYHLVAAFITFLTPVLGGVAAVAAIVLFTVAIRLLLMPLSLRALRGQAAAARLAPQLQALRQRYAKQPERLQREMTALYKREGTSMFASITPFLLQWPLLSVVYVLFRSGQVGGKTNTLLTRHLFGVALGSHWLSGAGPASTAGLVFLAVFALLAVLCWLSIRLGKLMNPTAAPALQAPSPARPGRSAKPGAGKTTTKAPNEPGVLLRVLPYLTVVVAAFVPLAAGIYLLTSTGWALAERAFFWRTGRIPPGGPAITGRSAPEPRYAAPGR